MIGWPKEPPYAHRAHRHGAQRARRQRAEFSRPNPPPPTPAGTNNGAERVALKPMSPLVLKRIGWNKGDFDVLEDRVIVGRIYLMPPGP